MKKRRVRRACLAKSAKVLYRTSKYVMVDVDPNSCLLYTTTILGLNKYQPYFCLSRELFWVKALGNTFARIGKVVLYHI